jgi:protein-disulfide isomerase
MRRWITKPLAALALAACAPLGAPAPGSVPPLEAPHENDADDGQRRAALAASDAEEATALEPGFLAGGPVPIESDDAVFGAPNAPLTLVAFMDLECPFCQRVQPTIERLRRDYAADLRYVFKHNPLPFHEQAKPAAVAAQAVLALGGPRAFERFTATLFDHRKRLGEDLFYEAALDVGIGESVLRAALRDPRFVEQVERDMATAQELDAHGVPAFFLNGVKVSGAQPYDAFRAAVEEELPRVRALARDGLAPAAVYVARTRDNFAEAPPSPAAATGPAEDTTLHRVPVGSSPVDGSARALVTIVEFSGFQCPFCKRVQPTLVDLKALYGDKLRIVFKHNPLPFHTRSRPAANLAVYALKVGGTARFFEAVRLLFESSPNLEDADLERVAEKLRLNPAQALRAARDDRYAKTIEADQALVEDFGARGTPHFFINGHRLGGAQPLEKFKEVIDERLKAAEALVKSGTPPHRVYAAIMKTAEPAPGPDTTEVGPPPPDAPYRGAPNGKIVVQLFSDFECPFCKRVRSTLDELLAAYPGRIKLVWRHLPLPFHKRAVPAAEAALEAYAQRGNDGFWNMEELLFSGQSQPGGLDAAALETYAKNLGLDLVQFRRAMAEGRHRARIQADADAAKAAGFLGTPVFSINGYFLSGTQSPIKFKRVVDYALEHPRPSGRKKPAKGGGERE